ncbi:MAG: OmpH family outer membrane protein [Bryobacterales bacterium]|nr:OmpH family outer membrane protein [Bryobacterales bacterium]
MQNKLQWLLLPLLATQLVGIAAAQAPTKVGIISVQQALVATRDGQKAVQELEQQFAPKRKELEKKQESIRQMQAQLQKGSAVLSEEQRRKLMADIDQLTKAFNRDQEDYSAELEQAQGKILQELGQKMMAVLDKYAKEKGFAIILDVSNQQTPVLYAANEVDVTKDIIELYDKNVGTAAPAAKPAAAPAPAPAPPVTKKK